MPAVRWERLDNPPFDTYAVESMTDRLYYRDSFLCHFDAEIAQIVETPRPAVILDRTAFYPQVAARFMTRAGSRSENSDRIRVTEVADSEDGHVVHYLEAPLKRCSTRNPPARRD